MDSITRYIAQISIVSVIYTGFEERKALLLHEMNSDAPFGGLNFSALFYFLLRIIAEEVRDARIADHHVLVVLPVTAGALLARVVLVP